MLLSEILKKAGAPQDQIDLAIAQEKSLDKANDEAAHHRKSKATLKEELARFDGIDPVKFKETQVKIDALEQERLKGEGKFDEALEKATKLLKGEIDTLKGQLSGKDSALSTALIDNEVMSSIGDRTIDIKQVLTLIRSDYKMEDNKPVVMDGDKHKLNAKGERMSVAEHAASFLDTNPQHAKAKGGGHGSGGSGGRSSDGESMLRSDFEALSPVDQSAHCTGGGTITDN